MSVFSSVLSGLFSLREGKAKQKEFKTQAAAELFEAGNERISALRSENQLTDDLFSTIAGQNVAFIAANIDPGSPLAITARQEAIKTGEDDARAVRLEGILKSQRRRARARSLKRAGKSARLSGIVAGLTSFADAGSDLAAGKPIFGG